MKCSLCGKRTGVLWRKLKGQVFCDYRCLKEWDYAVKMQGKKEKDRGPVLLVTEQKSSTPTTTIEKVTKP
ncbi:hypothetical protein MM300_20770 [Evansella sp. LMS18]|uniref:hypothetical protein n=1 Tax=Evansella sp. LMS18 TaxID=2924033 RepID=UPI0020D0F23F|nr:hypothetical protein [Evansella sp. LMS18]UTR10279.1 hypothetical protein MM300_20770 [Evansella sp. LMS18]